MEIPARLGVGGPAIYITLLDFCQQSKCTKIKAGWVSYSHPAFQQAVCTLLPQIYFLSLIPTATKRTSEKKTWWRSLSLRKEHFQKNPQLIILAPYKAGLLNNTPKLKSININNKYRRCRGRARVNQFNHFLYCTCIITWAGLVVKPLSMITCEIEDNRHFA